LLEPNSFLPIQFRKPLDRFALPIGDESSVCNRVTYCCGENDHHNPNGSIRG
jgi:hypothetical protein